MYVFLFYIYMYTDFHEWLILITYDAGFLLPACVVGQLLLCLNSFSWQLRLFSFSGLLLYTVCISVAVLVFWVFFEMQLAWVIVSPFLFTPHDNMNATSNRARSKMSPFSTDEYHKVLQKMPMPGTKMHRYKVLVEVNGKLGNETTLPVSSNSGHEHANRQLASSTSPLWKWWIGFQQPSQMITFTPPKIKIEFLLKNCSCFFL